MSEAGDSGVLQPKAKVKPEWTIQICGLVVLNTSKNQPGKGHWAQAFLTPLATYCFGEINLETPFQQPFKEGAKKAL